MKNIIKLLCFLPFLASCGSGNGELSTDLINNPNSATENADNLDMPQMVFVEESFDFGDISEGEKVEHNFKFKNSGKSDLIISSAVGSCGCTVPSYPKEPVKPGDEGIIKVVFDSNGKQGAQHKRVTVVANTNPNKTMVAIMANVLVPEEKTEE